MRLKFFQEIVTVLQTMTSYQETRVKLTNRKLSKLKFAAKNKAGTILILNKKIEEEEQPHEIFLTIKKPTKIRNAFANNISTGLTLI